MEGGPESIAVGSGELPPVAFEPPRSFMRWHRRVSAKGIEKGVTVLAPSRPAPGGVLARLTLAALPGISPESRLVRIDQLLRTHHGLHLPPHSPRDRHPQQGWPPFKRHRAVERCPRGVSRRQHAGRAGRSCRGMGVSETQLPDSHRVGALTKLEPVCLAIPPAPRKIRNSFAVTPVGWE